MTAVASKQEQKCQYRDGCKRKAVFEVTLGGWRTTYRCEEHAKRQYFLSNEVDIVRIDDPNDEASPPIEVVEKQSVAIEDFGKDHWSLLAYVETRCVDYQGKLDFKHMRINEMVHHGFSSPSDFPIGRPQWQEDWGTRLKGYFEGKSKKNQKRKLSFHDDLDCLSDMEDAGLLVRIGENYSEVKLTELGIKYAHAARIHKINGGQFATFDFKQSKEHSLK